MTDHRTRYLDRAEAFTQVTREIPSDRWCHPSPCPGWSATDVVDHVVDSQRDFLLRHDLAVGERPVGDPARVWFDHVVAVRRVADDVTLRAA